MQIKVLAILPGLIPSTMIDIVVPLLDLHKFGKVEARITIETLVKRQDIDWCDIVLLCRNIQPETSSWFLHILEKGVPYIYDLDDNFFDIPNGSVLGEYFSDPLRMQMLRNYIAQAALVRVYSRITRDRVFELNSNVEELKAPVVWDYVMPVKRREWKHVNIVYSTSRSQDYLAEIFKPALVRIIEKYTHKVRIHFLGYNPHEFKRYRNVYFQPIVFDYETFMRSFSSAGYDIGLAPLLDDKFHLSKTNNKFREYGSSHIAGIYSNVKVYSSCVENNWTGLLVGNNPNEWFDAMEMLIERSEYRLEMQERAYKYVRANYSQENFAEIWLQQIDQVLARGLRYSSSNSTAELPAEKPAGCPFRTFILMLKKFFRFLLELDFERILNYIKMFWVLWKVQIRLRFLRRC